MKNIKYIIVSMFIVIPALLFSQTETKNYIQTSTVKTSGITSSTSVSISNAHQGIQYLDGLGRKIQIIQKQSTPDQKDLIQVFNYDNIGRENINYLPYASTNTTGNYVASWSTYLSSFYNNPPSGVKSTTDPWAEKAFEASPLNRIVGQGAPGYSWQLDQHPIDIEYQTNTSSEVKLFTYNSSTQVASSTGYYPATKLYKTITTDENGNTTTEYKDLLGKVVLKKNQTLSTYYVYDDFGNLGCVIPPKAFAQMASVGYNTSSLTQDLEYTYKYDDRNRLVEKKIPGQDVIYLVYNELDNLVLTQDGNQRANNKWLFTKYDALGRPIISGVYSSSSSRTSMQTTVNADSDYYETFNTSTKVYSNIAFPSSISEYYSYTYYDNYSFIPSGETQLNYHSPTDSDFTSVSYISNPKGLPTGTKVKKLGTSEYLYSSSYYDKYDRIIQTVNDNAKGGYDITYTKNDFIGKSEIALLSHYNGSSTKTMKWWYEYDNAGRLLNIKHKINSQAQQWIVKNEYNELGQLIEKDLHAYTPTSTSSNFWQSVDYRYNERGWLTSINSSDLAYDASINPTDYKADLFGMELLYQTAITQLSTETNYNGNISAMKWKVSGGSERGYGFQYDDINRISRAKYGEGSSFTSYTDRYSVGGTSASTDIEYDENGNIEKLWRKGYNTSFREIDKLTYTYSGNRLTAVNDAIADNGYNDFRDGSSSGSNEYRYDANGNMTDDDNKGIVDITYNYLNLPQEIDLGSGKKIKYIYTADGNKLAKEYYVNSSLNSTTYYAGSFVYVGSTLEYVLFDEGRLVDNSGTFKYEYFLKDHLGNTRVTFSNDDNNSTIELEQEDHYYPFGMNFAGVGGTSANPVNKYKYNGKELQSDHNLNWYDYGARFYDPTIARWNVIDPMAESMSSWSPYNYTFNNPILFIDPDGMAPDEWDYDVGTRKMEWKSDKGGSETQYVNVKKDGKQIGSASVSGDKVFAYKLRNSVFVTNKDRAFNDKTYNSISGYEYTADEFKLRSKYTDGSGPIKTAILQGESKGNSIPISSKEEEKKYGYSALRTKMLGLAIITTWDLLPSLSPKFKGSGKLNFASSSSVKSGLSGYKGVTSLTGKTSWNKFLQFNKGKYSGNSWQRKAAEDYYKSNFYK